MDTHKQRISLGETLTASAKAFVSALFPPFIATFGKTVGNRLRLGLLGLAISVGGPPVVEATSNLFAPVYEGNGIEVRTSYHPPQEIIGGLRISTLLSPHGYIYSLGISLKTRITDRNTGLDATVKGKPIYFDSGYDKGQGAYRIKPLNETSIRNNSPEMSSEETRMGINYALDTLATSMNSNRWEEQRR